MVGFQTQVNVAPAPAVEGDFASTNPRTTVLAGPGGLVAGPGGLIAGRFAWTAEPDDGDGFPANATNSGAGAPIGFFARTTEGVITQYLQEYGMMTPAGFQVTLFDSGDFWIRNTGAGIAIPGMKAFANSVTGLATFAAAGTTPATGGSGSASSIAASTGSFTGSIDNSDILTITAVGSGVAVVGGTLSGTGVATGTRIVQQLTGAAGGVGTYRVNIGNQTVASTTISETYGTLTVGGTVAGAFAVGDTLSGSGVTAGTNITALGTGTGGAGTYIVTPTQTAGSTAITAYATVETGWYCWSTGGLNELVKISRRQPNPVS